MLTALINVFDFRPALDLAAMIRIGTIVGGVIVVNRFYRTGAAE